MQSFQTTPLKLPTQQWVAGATLTFDLKGLKTKAGAAILHATSIDVEVALTSAYTTAPTNVGQNAAINRVEVFDGERQLVINTGFNGLRVFERLMNGGIIMPDMILGGGTGNPRYIRRRIYFGPPQFAGSPTDFCTACAQLTNGGTVTVTCGALTDISADCTSASGPVNVTVNVVELYEVRICPWVEFGVKAITADDIITGRALYAFLALLDSTAFGPFTVGDLTAVTVSTGVKDMLSAVNVAALNAAYQADWMRGSIDTVMGEQRNVTYDVSPRQLNLTAPTAAEASVANLQPLLSSGPGCRISKIACIVPQNLTIQYTGSGTTTLAAYVRIRPLSASALAITGDRIFSALETKRAGALELRLLSGKNPAEYKGPLSDYLPHQIKLAA